MPGFSDQISRHHVVQEGILPGKGECEWGVVKPLTHTTPSHGKTNFSLSGQRTAAGRKSLVNFMGTGSSGRRSAGQQFSDTTSWLKAHATGCVSKMSLKTWRWGMNTQDRTQNQNQTLVFISGEGFLICFYFNYTFLEMTLFYHIYSNEWLIGGGRQWHACQYSLCWSEDNFQETFLSLSLGFLGIELRTAGLAAGAFICWAILQALVLVLCGLTLFTDGDSTVT